MYFRLASQAGQAKFILRIATVTQSSGCFLNPLDQQGSAFSLPKIRIGAILVIPTLIPLTVFRGNRSNHNLSSPPTVLETTPCLDLEGPIHRLYDNMRFFVSFICYRHTRHVTTAPRRAARAVPPNVSRLRATKLHSSANLAVTPRSGGRQESTLFDHRLWEY